MPIKAKFLYLCEGKPRPGKVPEAEPDYLRFRPVRHRPDTGKKLRPAATPPGIPRKVQGMLPARTGPMP